jgi:hypothetical protein
VSRVLEQVRTELAGHRAAGAPFDHAWPAALDQALDGDDGQVWLDVLHGTRFAWAAAYERRPATRAERALELMQDPDAQTDPDALERICEFCDGPIPARKRNVARYCSHVCQRAANGRRPMSAAA